MIQRVMLGLEELFPEIVPELNYNSDYQCLVAVMLSAQCTDKRVNQVTKVLFKDFGTAEQMTKLSQSELERMIYSLGFFRNKAKNVLAMSKVVVEKYGGQIPKTAEELEQLPGVGRKTANVVASALYGEQKIGVDTHVLRVTNRLGLVNAKTPQEVERQWYQKYPKYNNHDTHLRLVLFGRYYCKAKKPSCDSCGFVDFCKYYKSKSEVK